MYKHHFSDIIFTKAILSHMSNICKKIHLLQKNEGNPLKVVHDNATKASQIEAQASLHNTILYN